MSWLRGLGPSVCFVLVLFSAALASAQANKRVVVLEFSGPGSTPVRGHVVSALQKRDDVEVISSKEAEAARQRLGVQWGSAEAYQRVGAELGASAFVEGSVSKVKKKWKANVRVRDASTGLPADDKSYVKKSLPQLGSIEKAFWGDLGPAIKGTSAPDSPASKPEPATPTSKTETPKKSPTPRAPVAAKDEEEEAQEEPAEEQEEPQSDEPELADPSGKSARHPALIAWGGPRLMWRTLKYSDEDTELSAYENTPGSPAVNLAMGAQWFPGAHKRGDWASDFGIEGDFDYSLGLKSRQAGKNYKTTAYEFSGGVLYRLPLDSFEPRFRVGYLRQVFAPDVPSNIVLPSVAYSSLRLGVGTGILLVDWLNIDVNFAYLYVLDTGDIGKAPYAPDISTNAFEVNLNVGTFIKDAYGIRAGVDFRRYAFDFGTSAADGYSLPKEGSDHYVRLTLAFVYYMPGVSKRR